MPDRKRQEREMQSRINRKGTRNGTHMMSRLQIDQDPEATGQPDRKGKGKPTEYSPPSSPPSTGDSPAYQAQSRIQQNYQQFRHENDHIISPFELVTEQLGEMLDRVPPEFMAEWIKESDPDGRMKSVLERAWGFYSTVPIGPQVPAIHQPTFAHFQWFSNNVSATYGIVDYNEVASMKEAYKLIEDIDLVVYMERLCHIGRWLEGNYLEVQRTGETTFLQYTLEDLPKNPAMLLIYVHEHQNTANNLELWNLHRDLLDFRRAVDETLLIDYLKQTAGTSTMVTDLFNNNDLASLIKTLNKGLEKDGKIYRVREEGVNWKLSLDRGRTWKWFCKAFSSRNRADDRGILLLLSVMLKDQTFTHSRLYSGNGWELAGVFMTKNQVFWIAEYIKAYFPGFMKMTEKLDWFANEIYQLAYINPSTRRDMENELRSVVYGRYGAGAK